MGGKKQWVVSSNGPDWIDVTTLMTAIGGIHECHVELTVITTTQGHNGLLAFTLEAWIDTVEAHQTKVLASVAGAWPNEKHKDFAHAVFEGLYRLDAEVGKGYAQKTLLK
jgi:hypothetical protein